MKHTKMKPPYTPLTQQRLCCVPCAVQWILYRRGLPIFTQEEMGIAWGLTVPRELLSLFGKGVKTAKKKPILGWGSQNSDEPSPYNKFFKKKRIPLHVTYIPYSELIEFDSPAELIAENLAKGNDVMVITYMSALDPKKDGGHALVASEVIPSKRKGFEKLILGDPSPNAKKFYEAKLRDVLKGMTKEVGKTERGIYIFEDK